MPDVKRSGLFLVSENDKQDYIVPLLHKYEQLIAEARNIEGALAQLGHPVKNPIGGVRITGGKPFRALEAFLDSPGNFRRWNVGELLDAVVPAGVNEKAERSHLKKSMKIFHNHLWMIHYAEDVRRRNPGEVSDKDEIEPLPREKRRPLKRRKKRG